LALAAESDLIAKLRSGTAITPNTFRSGYRAKMGPAETEPKAILRRAGAGPNAIGSCWIARSKAMGSCLETGQKLLGSAGGMTQL